MPQGLAAIVIGGLGAGGSGLCERQAEIYGLRDYEDVNKMTKKRLTRDLKWGFQYFPYYQMRIECDRFHGWAALNELTDGELTGTQ